VSLRGQAADLQTNRGSTDVAASKTRAIIDDITRQIRDGALRPGDRLPSATVLRTQYGVSITVVRNAVLWLEALGLVQGVRGVGVFVTPRTGPDCQRHEPDVTSAGSSSTCS